MYVVVLELVRWALRFSQEHLRNLSRSARPARCRYRGVTVTAIKYIDWMVTCPMLQLILLVLSGPDCTVPCVRSHGMLSLYQPMPTHLVDWRRTFDL